jgi:protoporphyrin/coproporphyrin ferrochelatase
MSQRAVLLVNLGSPNSPSVSDIRKYLREFLMDHRVLDAPYPIRFGIVHFMILPFRPKRSAEAYRKIWQPEGSPLVVTSRKVQADLQRRLRLPVELAMRYQNPSIKQAVKRLRAQEVKDLLLIPMFPHYAMSSYETAVDRVKRLVAKLAPEMSLSVMAPYYNHPDYISALVGSAAKYLKQGYDHLLFSFHGLPERHLRKSDPTNCHCLVKTNCCDEANSVHDTCYRAQCFKTVQAFTELAGVPNWKFSIAFQSRLGRDPWLKPYTDQVIECLGTARTRKLLVICPAFVTDCLETLEEIGIRGRESFLQAGGEELTLIPCLNQHPLWLAALEKMVREWMSPDGTGAQSIASESGENFSPAFAGSRQSQLQKTSVNMENV